MQQEEHAETQRILYVLSVLCCVASCLVAEGITAALSFYISRDNFFKSVAVFSLVGIATGFVIVWLNKYAIWRHQRGTWRSILLAVTIIFVTALLVSLAGYSIEWFVLHVY